MPTPRVFFSSVLPAQPTRPFTTKTFCARAALNRGLSLMLSLSLLASEHSSFSFPAQSAHFGLCVVHGKGEHTRVMPKPNQTKEPTASRRSTQLSVTSIVQSAAPRSRSRLLILVSVRCRTAQLFDT